MKAIKQAKCVISSLLLSICCSVVFAAEEIDLFELSLFELLQIKVSTASGVEEYIQDVPATILVITEQQIRQRAYTDFEQILKDLPGFDVIETHGIVANISYQRGHRTNFTDRIILMVDGVVVNSIWTQQATLAQQIPVNHIKRIEVLYGPAGAVYGANAFQGVIHIMTKTVDDFPDGKSQFAAKITHGSFNTTQADVSAIGLLGEAQYSMGIKTYQSDGVALDSTPQWGFADETRLNNSQIWGPVLDLSHNGVNYGEYYSPIDSLGFFGTLKFNKITLGIIQWQYTNGYGLFYPFDLAQPNVDWGFDVSHRYIHHEANYNDRVTIKTLLQSIEEQEGGGFVFSDDQGDGTSKLTIQDWKSASHAWKFRQDYESQLSDEFRLQGGVKYQSNVLANQWDICGDVVANCSSGAPSSEILTTDPGFIVIPQTNPDFSSHKQFKSTDKGAYVLGSYGDNQYRLSAAIRHDKSSAYGSFTKKRLSGVYHFNDYTTIKYIYGEAFQEPSALVAWAEVNGEVADAQVEEVANHEIILMHYMNDIRQELSLYRAAIDNVILLKSSGAENAKRTITGLEYRANVNVLNFIGGAADITGLLYYTYTDSQTDHTYDFNQSLWIPGNSNTGDIAPHKVQLAINVPLSKGWRFNMSANHSSERNLYSTNTLNQQGIKVASQTIVDMAMGFNASPISFDVKVQNVFDEEYFLPGALNGDAGNDFFEDDGSIKRASAFHNSLIPQTGRTWFVTLGVVF